MTRTERLMPGGVPRWIRCYDAEKYGDRYTVVYTNVRGKFGRSSYPYVGMSAAPYWPQGICQHGESAFQPVDRPAYGHLGKRIRFADLPADCQRVVIDDYREIWDLTPE